MSECSTERNLGCTVVDTFAGSNTTGSTGEKLDRAWPAVEKDRIYLVASALRLADEFQDEELARRGLQLSPLDNLPVEVALPKRVKPICQPYQPEFIVVQ